MTERSLTSKPERQNNVHWTADAYAIHNEALRAAEEKFQAERDRRYAELAIEREKALGIKEKADLAALQLAREIQSYKDEKANELREQINSERRHYASRDDLASAMAKIELQLDPLTKFVASQQGRREGITVSASVLVGSITAVVGVMTMIGFLITYLTRQH